LKHPSGEKPLFHPRYLDFAAHYGFEPRACNVRKPNEKGRVESGVGHVKVDTALEKQFDYLKLPYCKENFRPFAAEGNAKHWSHLDYLARLIEGEAAARQDRAVLRRIKAARFPVTKTLDSFRWDWPKKINQLQIQDLFRLRFIEEEANAIFLGLCGLGKTHLGKTHLATNPSPNRRHRSFDPFGARSYFQPGRHASRFTILAIIPLSLRVIAVRYEPRWLRVRSIGVRLSRGRAQGFVVHRHVRWPPLLGHATHRLERESRSVSESRRLRSKIRLGAIQLR
jgi:hypothetical protein